MANASKKHMGAGGQGKHSGTGGMTDSGEGSVPDNAVLSNRDKSQHPRERGQDGKAIQTEQLQDHAANRAPRVKE